MRLGLVAAAALTLALPVSAGSQTAEDRIAWNRPIAPFNIFGPLYYVGTAQLSAFLLTTSEGHILIDGGLPESADHIAASVEALGLRLRDVKLILNNHAHADHAGGLAALKRRSGARLLASAADTPTLAAGRLDYGPRTPDFPPVEVDGTLRHGQRIALGGLVLTAHLTPGHTKGCTSFTTILRSRGRTMKALFQCSTTVAGMPLIGDGRYPGAARDFEASFATLSRLDAGIFLAMHASQFDLDRKRAERLRGNVAAFVDPAELPRRLAAARTAFVAELHRQANAAVLPDN